MRNDLEEGCRLLVQAWAMSYGLGFSPNCIRDVFGMIQAGSKEMSLKGDADNLEKIREAQENLLNIVSLMVADAKTRNLSQLERNAFHEAKLKVCPVYPFSWRTPPPSTIVTPEPLIARPEPFAESSETESSE